LASCVFIRFRNTEYIVTATHVLLDNKDLPILIMTEKGGGSFAGEFKFLRDTDLLDVAIARMPAKLRDKLPDITFYDISHCAKRPPSWEPGWSVIFGMPNTKNKVAPGQLKPSGRGVFGFLTIPHDQKKIAGHPKVSSRTHILLDWTGKKVTTAEGQNWNPPKLEGTSGGAMIDLGDWNDLDVLATLDPPMPSIEGIVSLWVDKKVVVGVRFSAMIEALDQAKAWPELDVEGAQFILTGVESDSKPKLSSQRRKPSS